MLTQVNGPAACSCMTKRSLEEQWERLVGSHFRVLKGDVHKIVANDGVVDDVLLTELGWVLSKGMFEGLVKGKGDRNILFSSQLQTSEVPHIKMKHFVAYE